MDSVKTGNQTLREEQVLKVGFEEIPQNELGCSMFGTKDPIALERVHVHLAPRGLTSGARERALFQFVGEGSSVRCDPAGRRGEPILRAMREGDSIILIQHYILLTEGMDMAKAPPRITLSIPRELRHRARIKAVMLDVSLSSVVRELLERWVAGEIRIGAEEAEKQN